MRFLQTVQKWRPAVLQMCYASNVSGIRAGLHVHVLEQKPRAQYLVNLVVSNVARNIPASCNFIALICDLIPHINNAPKHH